MTFLLNSVLLQDSDDFDHFDDEDEFEGYEGTNESPKQSSKKNPEISIVQVNVL